MRPFLIAIVVSAPMFSSASVQAQDAAPEADDAVEVIGYRTEAVDEAVGNALRFLARQQRQSGAWPISGRDSHAGTSLAVMAFLAAGYVPDEGPFGNNISRGVAWVINNQHPNGMLTEQSGHGAMYSHGIATLMLGEVVGMLPKEGAKPCRTALENAIRVILHAQNVRKQDMHAGGWRYNPASRDSDLSITGWQLLALRAAKDVGCDVPAANIDAAIDYVKNCGSRGTGFAYMPFRPATPTMTGTGITALEVCGAHRSPEVMRGAQFLIQRPIRVHESYFYYGAYYNSVGMFKVGGSYWTQTRNHLVDTLLDLQLPDGSWIGRGGERGPGSIYATGLSVLALTVEYRYLPIYQR